MTWRYRFTFFLISFFFFVIITKLFYWQVVKADELSSWGVSQYGQQYTLLPQRGEIRTSDNFPIATNRLSYLLFADPKDISGDEKKKISLILSSLVSVENATISALLNKDLYWVPIKSNIDVSTKENIEKLHLPGIGFEEKDTRFYPEASMGAQLIGFVAKDESGIDKGYFGLEGFYDRQLKGKPGAGIQIHDAFGRPIVAKMNNGAQQIDGRTIQLNIDRALQYVVEKKLSDWVDKFGATGGTVTIMEPQTGNILAMASFPSFDERNFQDYAEELYKNPNISDVYEPGSTFKPLVMAAALDAGLLTPESKCPICDGPIQIGDYFIHTWNDEYFKDTNMIQVIQHSDNTGMAYVAQTLGLSRLLSYLNAFGIGQPTGIDLQGEVSPEMRQQKDWYPIDLATAGFGQGITVTTIELLDAFASLANNGKRMEPHVVSKIITADGQEINIEPKVVDQPISEKTAKVMTEILVNAVDNGEAKFAKPAGYRIAGKTGTAQIPIAGHYDPTKTIASFIGYAPAENPKFVMLVVIDRPTSSIYGAETAAPVFFDIAKDLFAYYRIAPTQ